MKAGIIGLICILVLILTGLTVYTVSGRYIRKAELEESLGNAIEQSMEIAYVKKTYAINNEMELISDFTGSLLSQLSSESDIELKIMNVDYVNGCLDVEVTEKFKHFTGKEGSVTVRKTVIFEQFKDPNDVFYKVNFLNGDGSVFRTIQVYNEGRLTEPKERPIGFIRWKNLQDEKWDGDFSKIIVKGDLWFQAECS